MRTPKHILLRPSTADAWVNCPGSALVEYVAIGLPEGDDRYTKNGSIGHAILAGKLSGKDPRSFLKPKEGEWDLVLPDEELHVISRTAEQVKFLQQIGGHVLYVEQRIPIPFQEFRMFGTIDILLVNAEWVVVIDYKHGAGKKVEVVGNPQLMLYALGALRLFPGRRVSIAIAQPQGIGDGITMIDVTPAELETAARNLAAAVTRAFLPVEATYAAGSWCQWCSGKRGLCPALLCKTIEIRCGKLDKDANLPDAAPPWWILDDTPTIQSFLKTLREYAFATLRKGGLVPGWRLESVPGNRQWRDVERVAGQLAELLGGSPDDFINVVETPIGLTDADKILKRKQADKEMLVRFKMLFEKPDKLKMVRSKTETPGIGDVTETE